MLDGAELARRHPAELLGRSELGEAPAIAAAYLAGRRVLVTGAGGSVGRPLAAAIAAAGPASLTLVDHHEASLWELHRLFGQQHAAISLLPADVRNTARMADLLRRTRPEVIIHLAAYKQVSFGEVFSDETFAVNVMGTQALLRVAVDSGVERFVYPSSDKACNPPSLYGATKRLCELLVRRAARAHQLAYNVARFVNILGTRGSVVETFALQAREGQQLTVTDPRMTRYWISMNEALWLLLSAAALPSGEQVLMLDAREEIPVVEVARRVCTILGVEPSGCGLAFGKPRPGERLREELLSASEAFEPGPRPGLLRVVDRQANRHLDLIDGLMAELCQPELANDPAALRQSAMRAARELQ